MTPAQASVVRMQVSKVEATLGRERRESDNVAEIDYLAWLLDWYGDAGDARTARGYARDAKRWGLSATLGERDWYRVLWRRMFGAEGT